MMPKVSICIPTYNRKDYLKKTLDSVFAQTYPHYEVVVVDDGSKDGTQDMIRSLSKPVRYLWQENGGDAQARNKLIELAECDYITFIDSDDRMYPDTVERLVDAIKPYDYQACSYGDYIRIDSQGNILPTRRTPLPSGNITIPLFQKILVHSCGSMFPKKALMGIGKFDTTKRVCSDYKAWLKLSLQYPFIALEKPSFQRRRHSGNLSAVSVSNIEAELKVLEEFYYQEGGKEIVPENMAKKRFAKEHHRIAKSAWEKGDKATAREHWKQASLLCYSFKYFFYHKLAKYLS